MKKFSKALIAGFSGCLIYTSVFAQIEPVAASTELALFETIPTVTLPTRLPQPITEAPAAISVITDDDIAHSGYTNIWDLLRSQPGVDVAQVTGNMVAVTVRGFNSQYAEKLQVLLDGRTIFDPLDNGTFWYANPILLEDIERIEIMRGPDSVLYGFNSFNGTINIITKDPKDTRGFLTKVTAGTHSTQQYFGRLGETIGKLDFRLSYGKDNSLGLGDDGGKDLIDAKRLNTVNCRSRYTISEDKNVELLAGTKAGNVGVTEESGNENSRYQSNFQQIKYNHDLSKDNSFFIQFFRNYVNKNFDDDYEPHDINYEQYDLEFQHNFKAFKRHSFVWGGGYRQNKGRMNILADPINWYHDTISRVFGQDAITLTDKFTYYCGLEWAENNYTGSDWSTRQTLMYNIVRDHFLRLTFARAYHAFGLFDYFASISPAVPIRIGNPDLERESVNAYELGYRCTFLDKKLSLDLQFFYNDIDKIKYDVDTLTPFSPTLGNGNRARSEGVETSLEYKPVHWLKAYFNHSYLSVDDKKDAWKSRDPKHKVNLGGTLYMKEKYFPDYVDMKLSYVSGVVATSEQTLVSVKVPQYCKLDIKIAKKFFKDRMEIGLTGLNLLEPNHYEYSSYKVNRQILGSLKMEF